MFGDHRALLARPAIAIALVFSDSLSPFRYTPLLAVNMVDPKGNVPGSVVKITVPDRAMVIARIRKVCQNRAVWSRSPTWAQPS